MSAQVSIIIVSYNTRELLDACLASLRIHIKAVKAETIVIDNASTDGSPAMVRTHYPEVILIESGENLGFGRANNLGFQHSTAPIIFLFNSDALLLEDTPTALVKFLDEHPRTGIVGPDVILMDGTRQPKTRGMLPSARVMLNQNLLLSVLFARSRFFAGLYVEHAWAESDRVGWVSGVCMAIRREAYAQTGGFDPSIFMYAEDVDLCRRCADLGWETWRVNSHAIKHLCGGSTKTDGQILKNRVLQQRNFQKLIASSMGPCGRLITRGSLACGLMLRVIVRGLATLLGRTQHRLAFRADWHCLADLLGFSHAYRN